MTPPPSRTHPGQQGFTLLEALVATVVLGITLTAAVSLLEQGIRHTARWQGQMMAAHCAAQQLTRQSWLPADTLPLDRGPCDDAPTWHWVRSVQTWIPTGQNTAPPNGPMPKWAQISIRVENAQGHALCTWSTLQPQVIP